MLQICQNIKQARVSSGLSQQEVADRLTIILKRKVDRDTYKNWEVNTEPTLSNIKTIAEAIGVPAHSLLKNIIDYSAVLTESRPDVQFLISLSADDFDKVKFSLSVLGEAFSLERNLNINKPQGQLEEPSGKRKPHLLKEQKGKQKDIS